MAWLICDDHLFQVALVKVFDKCYARNGSVSSVVGNVAFWMVGDGILWRRGWRERESNKERFCLVEMEANIIQGV